MLDAWPFFCYPEYECELVRVDMSEQVRSFLSVRVEGTLVKQDQERGVGKGKCHLQSTCFMPGVLHRLSYLILKIVTTLFRQKFRDEETEAPVCEVIYLRSHSWKMVD